MVKTPSTSEPIPSNAIIRLLFVATFNLINMVVSKFLLALALYEFLSHLLTGRVPEHGVRWGEAIANWTYRMNLFMTYKTERMPFPFHRLGPDPDLD